MKTSIFHGTGSTPDEALNDMNAKLEEGLKRVYGRITQMGHSLCKGDEKSTWHATTVLLHQVG